MFFFNPHNLSHSITHSNRQMTRYATVVLMITRLLKVISGKAVSLDATFSLGLTITSPTQKNCLFQCRIWNPIKYLVLQVHLIHHPKQQFDWIGHFLQYTLVTNGQTDRENKQGTWQTIYIVCATMKCYQRKYDDILSGFPLKSQNENSEPFHDFSGHNIPQNRHLLLERFVIQPKSQCETTCNSLIVNDDHCKYNSTTI